MIIKKIKKKTIFILLLILVAFQLQSYINATTTFLTSRVSISTLGVQGDGSSSSPSISDDGRYVVWGSNAYSLFTPDTNGTTDAFMKDMATGVTTMVSVNSSGVQGNSANYSPMISGNGNYVAFNSDSTNLVANDNNGLIDVFVRDLVNGTTERVSVTSTGVEAIGGGSFVAAISADGRYIVFHSDATNLVANDTNLQKDVFVHDRVNHTTIRVSVDSAGSEGVGGASYGADITRDGRYVVLYSAATNLVVNDTNNQNDVFRYDMQTSQVIRVSITYDGSEAIGGASSYAAISDNGRYVAYRSLAINLVANDTNAKADIFYRDITGNTTTRVSVNSSGNQANNASLYVIMDGSGRNIYFATSTSNFDANDTNNTYDIYKHDMVTGSTILVSKSTGGSIANYSRSSVDCDINGFNVVYLSNASNLVTGDTNTYSDIFLTQLETISVTSISPNTVYVNSGATSFTITGTGFSPTPTINLGADITVNSVTYISETQISVNATISGSTNLGLHNIIVTNPNGQFVTLTDALNVVPQPTATPANTPTPQPKADPPLAETPTNTPSPTNTPTPTPQPKADPPLAETIIPPTITPTPIPLTISVNKLNTSNIITGVDTYYYSNGKNLTIQGSASANTTIEVQLNGNDTTYKCTTETDLNGNYICVFTSEVPKGTYQIKVTAKDMNGRSVEKGGLVLGINTGLAQTGSPAIVTTIFGLLLFGSFVVSRKRFSIR